MIFRERLLPTEDMQILLEQKGQSEQYNMMVARGITLTESQFCTVFMDNRRTGKFFLSYYLAAEDILKNKYIKTRPYTWPGYYGPDMHPVQDRLRQWVRGFIEFCEEYYPEIHVKSNTSVKFEAWIDI